MPFPVILRVPSLDAARGGARFRPAWVLAPALLLALAATAACGTGSDSSAGSPGSNGTPATDTPGSGSTGVGVGGDVGGATVGCESRMPGELMTEDEAVVRFNPASVCPGYVTVAPHTLVTFLNTDRVAHSVVITPRPAVARQPGEETSTTTAAPLHQVTIDPGQRWQQRFDDVGVFAYRTDALQGFQGTVEVSEIRNTSPMSH